MAPRDPSDPNQRPSIFRRPEEDDHDLQPPDPPRRAQAPDWHDTATAAHATAPSSGGGFSDVPVSADGRARPSTTPPRRRQRTQVMAIGTTVVVLLAGAGFVAASVLRTQQVEPAQAAASVSPTPRATVTPEVTASPDATPRDTPAAPPAPTATVAPPSVAAVAEPPHELSPRGWASVSVGELNVRDEPGLSETSRYRLVRGAVVQLLDDVPVVRDGLAWYRVVSLGGTTGWAASGPRSSPFLETIAEAGDLIRCGPVTGKVYDAAGGSLTPADPVRIASLALPASAFDAAELATLELLRGNEQDACFAARASSGQRPVVLADFGTTTCGRPVAVGDYFELRVAIGQDVVNDYVAKRTTFVHPSLLLNGPQTDPMSINLRSSIGILAAADGATACVHSSTRDEPFHQYRMVDGNFCGAVDAISGSELIVRPASGEGRFRFLSSASWVVGDVPPVGERARLMVTTSLSAYEQYVNVWEPDPARAC